MILLICCSCTVQKKQSLFLDWDGRFSLGDYRGKSPESEDMVCIVQYAHKLSPRFVSDVEGANWVCSGAIEYKFGYPSHNIVEVFSDENRIEQVLHALKQPEHQEQYTIKSEHCLLIISISRTLNRQIAIRVPFVLTESGYAVTPMGKDRSLYKILTSALENRDIKLQTEKEKGEAQIRRSNAIYRLYQQARESENVNYKKLFIELKKLDATFGDKDPNELEQRIKAEKEALRQEHLLREEAGKKGEVGF
jgi:hypothetical protein